MNDIEDYAITLLHEGGESLAEDDMNESGDIDDNNHGGAVDLSIKMAHAVRDNAEAFLAWYRQVSA